MLILLTVTRSNEARGAVPNEFNGKLWTIPKERTKTKKRAHTVPLPTQAIELLSTCSSKGALVFATESGRKISDKSVLCTIRELGYQYETVHGLRSSFKDWVRATKGSEYSDEVSELCLAHVSNDATRAAYARDQLIDLRAKLLQAWADYCFSSM